MRDRRARALPILGGILLLWSCGPSTPPAQPLPRAVSFSSDGPEDAGMEMPPPAPSIARPPAPPPRVAVRPPPHRITTPMSGDPSASDLAAARLISHTCKENEEATHAVTQQRIKKMQEEVDGQFIAWKSRAACRPLPPVDTRTTAGATDYEWGGSRRSPPPKGAVNAGGLSSLGSADSAGASSVSGASNSGAGLAQSRPSGGPLAPSVAPSMPPASAPSMAAPPSPVSSPVARGAPPPPPAATHEAAPKGATPRRAQSVSGTNNQVAAVDEADIVKNDGTYVYLASNGALRIVEALRPRLLSVTRLSGGVRQMLVEGDRAVMFLAKGGAARKPCTYGYDCEVAADGTSTTIVVLDIADRTHPKTVRTIDLSGSLIAARRIGNTVHTVVADDDPHARAAPYSTTIADWGDDVPYCTKHVDAVHAKFEKLKRENEKMILAQGPGFPSVSEHSVTHPLCDAMHSPMDDGEAFTSVVSFDLTDDKHAVSTASVQTRPGTVFASESGLYLSVRHDRSRSNARQRAGRPSNWYPFAAAESELSDIHKFHIGPSPNETQYVGSGVVPGHVLNQFAMDEWYGYLRVASTKGRVPNPNVSSSVSVMVESDGGNLVRVGAVDGIAPTEDIRAVRFDDDRAYIVTFKKTDPLYVLDLQEPEAPRILGELKIPGFSTYLHRVDPSHLLSIGFDAQDHGNFAYFDGLLLQLFDVSNPTDPQLMHREKLGSRGSSSEAATDHLAFNFMADRGLLAIPVTECEGGGDGRYGNVLTFSGLAVYNVSLERGFLRLGGVDHGTRGANCNTWWSRAQSMVKRSIFMDDLVFSIAEDKMKVQRLDQLGTDLADIALMP